ncbi:MAG: rRNA maturation RNase YbeY [Hyphomicrobium sp.]
MSNATDLQTAIGPDSEPDICGWLTVDVIHDAGNWHETRAWPALEGARAVIVAALVALTEHPSLITHVPSDVCVALSDDANVRRLNAAYRNKDKPTNVLSFPAGDDAQEPDAPAVFLGDVVLALETVLREAAELGIPAQQHVQHLAVHGVLHLIGYDHETEEDAAVMEGLETAILANLGLPDPYAYGQSRGMGTGI